MDSTRPLIWVCNWDPSGAYVRPREGQTMEAAREEHEALGRKYTHGEPRVVGAWTAERIARLGIIGLYRERTADDCSARA